MVTGKLIAKNEKLLTAGDKYLPARYQQRSNIV